VQLSIVLLHLPITAITLWDYTPYGSIRVDTRSETDL